MQRTVESYQCEPCWEWLIHSRGRFRFCSRACEGLVEEPKVTNRPRLVTNHRTEKAESNLCGNWSNLSWWISYIFVGTDLECWVSQPITGIEKHNRSLGGSRLVSLDPHGMIHVNKKRTKQSRGDSAAKKKGKGPKQTWVWDERISRPGSRYFRGGVACMFEITCRARFLSSQGSYRVRCHRV